MSMASYKRLSPEDVHLSCPGLAKESSAVQEDFPVSPYVSVGFKNSGMSASLSVNSLGLKLYLF